MNRFVVIGLGHFGAHVARTLYAAGKEVIAIDRDADVVQNMAEYATHPVVADATDREALDSFGVGDADAAIISMGDRMDLSMLAALHVIEMGVPFVAVKALSDEHGRILTALGVDEVIHPEQAMAVRLANRLSRTDIVDFLPLRPGYSITEMIAPPEFVGKSLEELGLRNRLKVQLVGIQTGLDDDAEMNIVPKADDVIKEGDLLILIGETKDLDRVREIATTPPPRREPSSRRKKRRRWR